MDATKLAAVLQSLQPNTPAPVVEGLAELFAKIIEPAGDDDDARKRAEQRARKPALALRQAKRAKRLLELMERRNALIAAALGACTCWGADPSCTCGGRGGPGYVDPDTAAFEALIVPWIRSRPDLFRPVLDGARPAPADPT